ncbi:hypothetical protein B0H14DRAFT_2599463 [Mycena olivaceomarginata]|nr:hypothetical protein B0H14DRAFT_2599463 [Mycena olivaceomarginata]
MPYHFRLSPSLSFFSIVFLFQRPSLDWAELQRPVFSQRVDEEDRHSQNWTGINKHCSVIPGGALDYIDRLSSIYHHEPNEFDEFRSVREDGVDGSTRLVRPLNTIIGGGSRSVKRRSRKGEQHFGGPEIEEVRYQLESSARREIKEDLQRFRRMQEEIGESALYDPHIPSPALFDIEKVDLAYTSAATRSAVPGWSVGLRHFIVQEIWDLNLNSMKKVGFLISPAQDLDAPELPPPHQALRAPVLHILRSGTSQDFGNTSSLPGWEAWKLRPDTTEFLQLKISPYARSRPKVPVSSEMSGTIKYWCIDFQHWARRRSHEHRRYLRTGRAGRNQTYVRIRERFKGGYAPRLGEVFDNETGIERRKGLNAESTLEDMVEQKERELLVDAPPHLGGRTKASWEIGLDATSLGREVGPRMTSERRVEDFSTPMAYESGWADAMMRDDWMDPINHYIPNRNARLPRYPRASSEDFDDARSHVSISSESSRESREHTYSRRSASPELRGHRVYPARRARWLNNFADWGREATYESSLWRIPCENRWNPDVLALGYLIINEVSEFKMRPDSEDRTSRGVTKAMVDRHNKGPRLNPSPSMADVVQQYKANLGQIGLRPHAPCIIARGGVPSWILRAYLGVGHVAAYMEGPSMQISVHRDGANDSADRDGIDVTWGELSEGDYLAMSGLISGRTLEEDLYLYPTDTMLMEFSDHYYGEWNPFCDKTFERLKRELDSQRARGRTRSEWKKYFQSSDHGQEAPPLKVTQRFIEEGTPTSGSCIRGKLEQEEDLRHIFA